MKSLVFFIGMVCLTFSVVMIWSIMHKVTRDAKADIQRFKRMNEEDMEQYLLDEVLCRYGKSEIVAVVCVVSLIVGVAGVLTGIFM